MKRLLFVAALLTPLAPSANAATLTFTDPGSFAAALSGATTIVESYESAALDTLITSGSSFNGVTYSFNAGRTGKVGNAFARIGTRSLEALSDTTGPGFFTPGNEISMTFGTPLRAIGGYFNANLSTVDQFFLTAAGSTVTGGGAGDSRDVATLFFLGIISDTVFSTATFGSFAGTTGVYNFDDLTTVAAVPEPASWVAMIAGFALVGAAFRRRRPARVTYAT